MLSRLALNGKPPGFVEGPEYGVIPKHMSDLPMNRVWRIPYDTSFPFLSFVDEQSQIRFVVDVTSADINHGRLLCSCRAKEAHPEADALSRRSAAAVTGYTMASFALGLNSIPTFSFK